MLGRGEGGGGRGMGMGMDELGRRKQLGEREAKLMVLMDNETRSSGDRRRLRNARVGLGGKRFPVPVTGRRVTVRVI